MAGAKSGARGRGAYFNGICITFAQVCRPCRPRVGGYELLLHGGGDRTGAHNSTEQGEAQKVAPGAPPQRRRRGVTGRLASLTLLPFPLPRDALFLVVILVVFLGVVPFRSRE